MADVFNEQLIKRQPNSKDRLIRIAIIAGVVVVAFITFSIPALAMFGMIIVVIAAFLAYIFMGRLKREYEYIFTNGELDIDVIYNKSSRKRVFTGMVRDFEIMAHVEDPSHTNTFSAAEDRLDFSTGIVSESSYYFLTNYKGKRVAITIEPNEVMREAIAKVLTRRKFHPKNI